MNIFKKLFSKQKFACDVIDNLLKKNNIKEYNKHYTEGHFFYEMESFDNQISLLIDKKRIYIFHLTIFSRGKAEINLNNRAAKTIKDSIEFYLDDKLRKFGLIKEILEKY